MNITTWPSLKSSPMMGEIRELLKKRAAKGEATLSRKESNKTWREDILGVLSEDQKKDVKRRRQERSSGKVRTEEA